MKKKLLYVCALAALFAGCTDDYTDWADPQQADPESPYSVSFSATSVAAIDLAQVDADSVAIFAPSLTTDATEPSVTYRVIVDDAHTLNADAEGKVAVADLAAVVNDIYGRRPAERTLNATVEAYVDVNGTSVKADNTPAIDIRVTPEAPIIESAYYLIGNPNGWLLDATYPMTNGGADVYDNPVFTATIPAPTDDSDARIDLEFKVAPESAISSQSWTNVWGCTASDATALSGELMQGDGSQNIVQPASDGALYYTVAVNMLDATYTITPLSFESYIYMPGNHQGWSPATAEALYSPASDGVYTGYAYMNGDFKFTRARDWSSEYNANNFTSMSDGLSQGDGTNINMATPGFYQLIANIPSGSLTATLIETVGVCGAFNGWDNAKAPSLTYDATAGCWKGTFDMTAGEFKFVVNGAWTINFGGTTDNLVEDGSNLSVAEDGTYAISLYLSRTNGNNMYCTLVKQ